MWKLTRTIFNCK